MSNEITQADRELLAAEYERAGYGGTAEGIRTNDACGTALEAVALRAIAAARRQGAGGEDSQVGMIVPIDGHEGDSPGNRMATFPDGIPAAGTKLYIAPPSVPAGVEALVALAEEWKRPAYYSEFDARDCAKELEAALAQQPAAVGGFDAWFDEYSKQNYSEEMLAKAAWDAALAAQQEGAP